jgi:hypothetical protein
MMIQFSVPYPQCEYNSNPCYECFYFTDDQITISWNILSGTCSAQYGVDYCEYSDAITIDEGCGDIANSHTTNHCITV